MRTTRTRKTVNEAIGNFNQSILQQRSSLEAKNNLIHNCCIGPTRVPLNCWYPTGLTGVGKCHARAHYSAGAVWKDGMTADKFMEQPLPRGSQTFLLRNYHSVSLNETLRVYTDDAAQFPLLDYTRAANVLNAFCYKNPNEEMKDNTNCPSEQRVRTSRRLASKQMKDNEVRASRCVPAKR